MSYQRKLVEIHPPLPIPPMPRAPNPQNQTQYVRYDCQFEPHEIFQYFHAGIVTPWEKEIRTFTGASDEFPTEIKLRHDLSRNNGRAPAVDRNGIFDRIGVWETHPKRFDEFDHLDSTAEWTERIERWEKRMRLGDRPLPQGAVRLDRSGFRAYGQPMDVNPA